MTPGHRIEVVLPEGGKLSLDRLPFRAGQAVEVIVLPFPTPAPAADPWAAVDALRQRLAASGRVFTDSAELIREDRDR